MSKSTHISTQKTYKSLRARLRESQEQTVRLRLALERIKLKSREPNSQREAEWALAIFSR